MTTRICDDVVTATTDCGFKIASTHGLVYPLTPCHGATGKGLMDDDSGEGYIGCRSCYHEVSPTYGDCAILSDGTKSVTERIGYWITAERPECPDPNACATTLTQTLAKGATQ